MPVSGLLLAAGAGRRFGSPKALVRHRGELFVEHAARVLCEAGCEPVVVVLGAAADQVRAQAHLNGAVLVNNPDWAGGMGSSLRVGLTGLAGATAVVVLPVDTPWVTAEAVRRLADMAAPDALARASYDGHPGHPVLIGSDHWAGVAELSTGDAGAREYLRRHAVVDVPCEDIADGSDVDRPEDLQFRSETSAPPV
ncbi:MAG TPA: nucleotidyltransferase family protein [Pseudonocardiaceae bacterium]|jgi:CTP:molybdopterin cytidylyltransferase MocA|nr:nucleotidyltransferase family protein [Pseudonocardiaceae bacterium]